MKYKSLVAQCGMALALAGCQALAPEPTATPTATATPPPPSTPTITPSPTATLTPTASATPGLTSRGVILFTGFEPYPALVAMTGDGLEFFEAFRFEFPWIGIGSYWAPDASQVAVHLANFEEEGDAGQIGYFDTAAGIFTLPGPIVPSMIGPLSWSPDGRYIVFGGAQPDGNERDVYRIEVATGAITNLTRNSATWDSAPVYSSDGAYIFYTSDYAPSGKQWDDIWRMNADGSGKINLTDNGEEWEDNWAAVSPDSSTVAFLRSNILADINTPGGPAGLWLMDPDGSDQRFLASVPILFGREAPVWSPNGDWLALIPVGDSTSIVFLIDAETGEQTTFSVPGNAYGVTWSPDNVAFHFSSQTDDGMVFYIYSLESGQLHMPVDVSAGLGGWSPPVNAP